MYITTFMYQNIQWKFRNTSFCKKNLISTQMMHLIFYGILVYGLCIYFRNMCPGNDKYKKSLNLKHTTILQMTALTLNRI